jgi:hypothetical protein
VYPRVQKSLDRAEFLIVGLKDIVKRGRLDSQMVPFSHWEDGRMTVCPGTYTSVVDALRVGGPGVLMMGAQHCRKVLSDNVLSRENWNAAVAESAGTTVATYVPVNVLVL